jgi:hypothetical protein
MDPKKPCGVRTSNIKVRAIDGYHSDDSVLASDSDEECSVFQHTGGGIIISERDDSDTEVINPLPQLVEDNEPVTEPDFDKGVIYDDDENCVSEVLVIRKNISWNCVQARRTQQILPWKGILPVGPESPDSPIAYFRKLIGREILHKIVEESNKYVVQCDARKPVNITLKELEQFIGCCFFMSIFGLPQSKMYWQTQARVPVVAETLSHNRWAEIKSKLHFSDNVNQENNDMLHKIRPFLNSLVRNFNVIPVDEKLCRRTNNSV